MRKISILYLLSFITSSIRSDTAPAVNDDTRERINRWTAASSDTNVKDDSNTDAMDASCSIFLAPSSIPNSGFGIYTTREIQAGEYINNYLDSPSIVLVDNKDSFRTLINYLWSGNMFTEFESSKASVFVPSWSSYCNYHTVRFYITWLFGTFQLRSFVHIYAYHNFIDAIKICNVIVFT
jgi:hypothetical protein